MSTHGPGRRVLIVDDSDDLRELFTAVLRDEGFEVMDVASGVEAVDCAEAFHPDVVLMDLAMPHMNGLEAVRRLRLMSTTRDTPVVVVTGLGGPTDHEAVSRKAGCDLFLQKPCTNEELIRAVRSLLCGREWK